MDQPLADNPPVPSKARWARSQKKLLLLAALVVIAGGSITYWRLFVWQPAVINPFSAKILASAQFPLYYPKTLPTDYRIDAKSVTEPQQGVVVFDVVGPNGHKLYISEEARPSTFDLGGFYNKFTALKETPVSDGAVAVGRINNNRTEIASRATNKTWILSNTTAQIPLNQLTVMLESLTLSY